MKTAVVLFNLGGPDSLEAVEPFLANLFNDRDIFKLPFQSRLSKYIARKRAPRIIEEYKIIGGKSPIGYWTELQRKALQERLRIENPETDVFTAMRYWKPLTNETAAKVKQGKYEKIILLPLYPHYSVSTTGSSFNEWKRAVAHNSSGTGNEIYIDSYFNNMKYISALNQRIDEGLLKFADSSKVHILFSAHGTPVSYVKKGDPYSRQIKETVELVMKQRGMDHNYSLSYQSKVGPVKWLQPYTDDAIRQLGRQSINQLLVVPISFVSDHVETLYELDIEYRHIAEQSGIEEYRVMTGLNDSPLFVEALAEIAFNV